MKAVEIILLLFLMACSLSVFLCRNLLVAAILFMANSLIMSIIWVILQSPDLAITEAAVGAGVTGILLFITLYKVDGLRGKIVSEDSGKRGLRAFVDWVENGPDWEDEAGVHEGGAGGHGGENSGHDGENSGHGGEAGVHGRENGGHGGEADGHDGENSGHDGETGGHGEADTVHASEQAVKRNTKRTMGRRFAEFTEEHALRVFGRVYRAVAQIVCLAGMVVLLMMVTHLPAFGSADNPANNEVVGRYLENGLSETGAVNTVAGIILDYRAFDTFGESVVLFLAAVSVIALLRRKSESGYSGREDQRGGTEHEEDEERDIILEQVARLLVPFILMFGVYVVLNGHLSPGGGFSGGTVMGAGLILYANAFGHRRIHRFFSFKTFTVMSSSALMVYALSKGYSFFMGANHLESGIPLGRPGNIFSAGLILPLDICVGLVVAGTMYCFYSLFREGEV